MKITVAETDDNRLIQLLREGDHHAFRQIYNQYSGALLRRLMRLVKVEEVAEDMLQETFVRLWEKRATIDPDLPVKPWLCKVAENLVYQFYRDLARDARIQAQVINWFAEENVLFLEEETLSAEREALLHRAIGQLPPVRRQVFQLCKIDGLSYEQAAAQLGISPSTVSNHLLKANANIRAYLTEHKDSLFVLIPVFLANSEVDTLLIINQVGLLS